MDECPKVIGFRPTRSLRLYINKSGLLKHYKISQIMNRCLEIGLEYVFKESKVNEKQMNKIAKIIQIRAKRELLLLEKREENSRAYFLTRFKRELHKLLSIKTRKEDILRVLKIHIKISKSYEDFEDVTQLIKNIYVHIDRSQHNVDLIREYLKIQLEYFEGEVDVRRRLNNEQRGTTEKKD